MILIIIIIILIVIYYRHKNKQQEQLREENIMQGSDFQPIDESSNTINNVDNPFVNNIDDDTPAQNNDSFNYQDNNQDQSNPFIDDNSANYAIPKKQENGYIFPYCPVNDKSMAKSRRRIIAKISYDNNNYVAINYSYDGDMLLFQQAISKDGKTDYFLVNYGYLWIKLFNIYKEQQYGSISHHYINLDDMPNIPEDELETFLQVELTVRELSNEIAPISLSYDGINNNFYWQYGTVEMGGNSYALLVAQNNIEDTSIHKVTKNDNGGFTYTLITDMSLQRMIMNAYDKKNK